MAKAERLFAVMVGIVASLALSACDGGAQSAQRAPGDKLRVVATTTIIADLARQIGGEHVEVTSIMRVGEDPHVYEVRPRDAQTIGAADLVLMNGLNLEATLEHVAQQYAASDKLVRLAESPAIEPLGGQHGVGVDPHCWFNVEYIMVYVERARDALMAADPDHAASYHARARTYLAELRELHEWIIRELETVPREQRVMVTSHDAFQYYGARYDIDVHAVVGISTEQQPRPRDKQELERLVRQRHVKALFIETSVSQALNNIVKDIAARTGAQIGGSLYSDSLGSEDSPAGTYIGMVRQNTATIVAALR